MTAPSFKTCPQCGLQVVEQMLVCGRCGHDFRPPQREKRRRSFAWLLLLCVALLLLGLALDYFRAPH